MITVKEAIEALRNYQFKSDMCGYYSSDLIELIEQLKAENERLKSTMSEIRKHNTGTRALEVALAKIKELEQENFLLKDTLEGLKQKFNLGE